MEYEITAGSLEKLAKLAAEENRFFPRRAVQALLIAELAQCGEPLVAPMLLPYVQSHHNALRQATGQAIYRLMASIPVKHLRGFDIALREYYWTREAATGWDNFSFSDVANLPSGCLPLLTMHPNGRVRETAVSRLGKETVEEAIPYLLVRVNDWVKPIREKARELLIHRIQPHHALDFVRFLPLVLQLRQCERAEHQWLLDRVGELLLRDECAPALQQGFRSEDRLVRRICLEWIGKSGSTKASDILAGALDDSDPIIRLQAARFLLGETNGNNLIPLIHRLFADPFMPIRREALYALVRSNASEVATFLEKALMDRHSSMRELAQYHLRSRMDLAQVYRNALSGRNGAIAISGLGECGTPDDAGLLLPFLSSPVVRFRKATITALSKLSPENFMQEFWNATQDPSPRVAVAAIAVLRPMTRTSHQAVDSHLMTLHPAPSVRSAIVRLLSRLSKWDALPRLLSACRDSSDVVSRHAAGAINRWLILYNRSFIRPTPFQIEHAIREFRQSQEFLSSPTASEIRRLLKELTP